MKSKLAKEYEAEGRYVQVNKTTHTFVYDKGEGEAVLCLHGVPASSFAYKRVVDGLAEHEGMRGISFDMLGLGLASRPVDADYSWTGLGKWCCEVIEALKLDQFHLLIHDIGGAIGCEIIHSMPERILSVSMLNTQIINLSTFSKPFPMNVYTIKPLGELLMKVAYPFVVQQLMHMRALEKSNVFGIKEAGVWAYFLQGKDGGKGFLQVLRNFESTPRKEEFYLNTLKNIDVPKQIIWGTNDLGLTIEKYGYPLQKYLNIYDFTETNGSHFLQVDHADIVVQKIVHLIRYKYVEKLKKKHS